MRLDWKGSFYWAARAVVSWLAQAAGLIALSYVVPGLEVHSWQIALEAAAIIAFLNALLWPILSVFALRFLVYSFGVGALALNGAIVWVASLAVAGLRVQWQYFLVIPIGLALIESLTYALPKTADIEATRLRYLVYFRHALDGKHEFDVKANATKKPGVIFLEIDGLAESVLRTAIAAGRMPTLANWLKAGSHKIIQWETDLSSQTGASQAGLLHGNNNDIPAFRWFEKESNKIVVSSKLADAAIIEKRISDGNGLLAEHGASCSNLFSGDARNALLTVSRMKKLRRIYTDSWFFFYSNPYNFPRTVGFLAWDMVLEAGSRLRQWWQNVRPRLHRSLEYFGVRAIAVVLMREITTYTVIGDIVVGHEDVVYASYSAYDEVAHHSGMMDEDVFRVLRQLDKNFARIEHARKHSKRPYLIVVLSDHGQSNGATFKQRSGHTLGELVGGLIPKEYGILSEESPSREALAAQLSFHPREAAKVLARKILKPGSPLVLRPKSGVEQLPDSHAYVLASGNLGLVYFTKWKKRLTLEEINQYFPKLISGLLDHQYIGFLMVVSEDHGPTVLGQKGTYYLSENRIIGKNPLEGMGPRSSAHLLRENSFEHAPDILVNSFCDLESHEVAAFEELIGSHGGLGGEQSKPFLMYPSEWLLDKEKLVGAENVHNVLKRKLREISFGPKLVDQYA